ncbi:beta-ketoacyl synthase chain length factor [Paraliomyxa miuraensis]|uniref:beta-ketoacyl synthase chain length factor n=1 Tax=Paraliomyxa miuraensis TaxID=376150 RepID=UPI002255C3D4|nr:beta-ketoacyl synthase chain length factor [Paraliomyxa miuraensis]MCX4247037.1 beta-ketoacyl synthase chain length factor [Paraliomyxa miuraensis]
MSAYVLAQAAWMPGRADVDAVLEDRVSAEAKRPELPGYPSRLMRGTSVVTRMSASVAARALARSGVDPRTIPAVFGSAYGEVCIAIEQLEMMVTGDGQVSPALFKNSVHNTGAGVFSIAHGNHIMSTSLAAGPLTVAYSMLEGHGILDEGASHVLVVVADEALPVPLSEVVQWESFAAAWVLGREPPRDAGPDGEAGGEAGPWIRLAAPQVHEGPQQVPDVRVPPGLAAHPCRSALDLLAAIHRRTPGLVSLGREDDEAWSIEVSVEGRTVEREGTAS